MPYSTAILINSLRQASRWASDPSQQGLENERKRKEADAGSRCSRRRNHIIAERRAKLAKLREEGVAYPNDFVRKDLFGDLRAEHGEKTREELDEAAIEVAVSGRMMLKRVMGKAAFATVRDFTGEMQYFVTPADVGDEAYALFKSLDLGDIVAAEGTLFRTNKGELSVRVKKLRLMTKSIRPLPDKHKGLTDVEACCRQRYTDLIINEESRQRFATRFKAVSAVRRSWKSSLR